MAGTFLLMFSGIGAARLPALSLLPMLNREKASPQDYWRTGMTRITWLWVAY